MTQTYELHVLPERYGVVKLPPGTELNTKGGSITELLAVIHTPEETTVICQENLIASGRIAERGWRVLKVSGPLEFSLVGVLASILTPLAQGEISVFTLSTYSTDMVMVKGNQLKKAIKILEKAGFVISE